MSTNDCVTVTMVVRIGPAEAFRIFTDEIDVWWKRGPRYRLGDGVLRFDGGLLWEGAEPIGRVTAWEPGVRLHVEFTTWTFQGGEHTAVDIRFEAVGDGTRVTVEHRGWKRPSGAAEFRTVVGLWWGALLPGFGRSAGIVTHI